jgi:hypothetical protein
MPISIHPDSEGGVSIRQTFSRPAVYLDHWAVRRFSDNAELALRFTAALKASKGTWLFSLINLSEFTAMRDEATARRVEALIQQAFPHFYVLDTVGDTPYFRLNPREESSSSETPESHWMLKDLSDRAVIAGGKFNAHRFISDAISHADNLMPIFEQMKSEIADHITAIRKEVFTVRDRRTLVPSRHMPLSDVLKEELLIEPAGQKNQLFSANDAVDFLHAFPSCLLCDMVLLDSAWCHKVELATKRIREAGVEGRIVFVSSKLTRPVS